MRVVARRAQEQVRMERPQRVQEHSVRAVAQRVLAQTVLRAPVLRAPVHSGPPWEEPSQRWSLPDRRQAGEPLGVERTPAWDDHRCHNGRQ